MNVSPPENQAQKRILYVITKANWGGAQRYVYDLAIEAQTKDYLPSIAYGEPGLLTERASEAGIAIHQISGLGRDISLGQDLRAFWQLYRLFQRERPDVVHLNSSKASAIGALAARFAGIRCIVFTAHGWAFNEGRSFLSRFFFTIIHYFTVLFSHHTIAVSGMLAQQVKRWPFVQKKLTVIHLGIGESDLLTREAARAALIEHDHSLMPAEYSLWVGTIAELHPNKGLDVGIDVWKVHSEVKREWVILGGGQEEESLKKRSDGQDTIHFLGFVPDAANYLRAFDLFLLPSRTEALGYVLLEAGMASIPVIASNVGGIPEIITDMQTGMLVPIGDSDAIVTALSKLLNDEGLRNQLGNALHQKVLREFTKEQMVEKTFALYLN